MSWRSLIMILVTIGPVMVCLLSPHPFNVIMNVSAYPYWVVHVSQTSAIHKLVKLFSRIHRLPQLQTINLNFFPSSRNCHRVDVQASILCALVTSFSIFTPKNLISLSCMTCALYVFLPSSLPHFKPSCMPCSASTVRSPARRHGQHPLEQILGARSAPVRSSHQRRTP
jgi:hypothetical protein